MSEPTHIIEKMVVEINTDSQESAYAIKNDIGEFLEKELFPRLEKILDQFDNTGGVVRFNSLNLEIAPLRFSNVKDIEPEITRKLAEKLESSVNLVNGKKVEIFEGGKVENISATGNREKTFLFFLENGYLPWFGKEEYIAELTDLQNWQKSLTESNFTGRLGAVLQKKTEAVSRFVLQFEPEVAEHFLLQNFPEFRDVKKWMLAITEKQTTQFRRRFLQLLLLVSTGHHEKYVLQTAGDLLQMVYNAESSASKERKERAVSEVKEIMGRVVDLWLRVEPVRKDELEAIRRLSHFPEFGKPKPADLKSDSNEAFVPKESTNGKGDLKDISALEKDSGNSAFLEEEGEIAVSNAGLILLHPFLKPFFRTIEITNKKGIITEARRHLAVQMVHYLATGEEDFFEGNLVFGKFLCGIPLETPVPRESLLTQHEKNEANLLLDEVIKHWVALKNTSPDGLRQMFLQRNGKLFKKEKNYKLVVERKAQDILLEKLAWNISLVKIPWLKELLYVDW